MSDNEQPPISVLAINQYYAPDIASSGQLLADLCEGLAARGLRVTVVTGQPSYVEGLKPAPAIENTGGVEVHRVSMGKTVGRGSMLRRLFGYARFMLGAYRISRRLSRSAKPDVVVTMSNPPTVGLIGGRIARSADAKFLYILFDLFPDIAEASGGALSRWPIVQLWNRLNSSIFSKAHAIAVPGAAMKSTLVETKGIDEARISVIPNWPRPDLSAVHNEAGKIRWELGIPDDYLLILTAGNLGVMQLLDPLITAAGALQDSKIGFLFLGNGAQRPSLQGRATSEGLKNVWFLDFQPEDRFSRVLATADVCVVALESVFNGLSVPSRTYTYMSAGKPILAVMGPGDEIAGVLAEHQCGWTASSASEIVTTLQDLASAPESVALAGTNAASAARNAFSKERAIDRYYELIVSASRES